MTHSTSGHRNEVQLVGRLPAEPEVRELPSGDLLTTWRLVVDRPPSRRPMLEGARTPTVDTVDCVAWTAAVRRSTAAWAPGDVISVEGSIQRRFWRGPGGLGSRYEVDVIRARRVARAGRAVTGRGGRA